MNGNFMTLLWKDYRQNRRLLITVCIFVALPYVIACIFWLGNALRPELDEWQVNYEMGVAEYVMGASFFAMFITAFVAAFVAGNAIAGERTDRSIEFFAPLPIPVGAALASKIMLAIGTCVVLALINTIVLMISLHNLSARSGPSAADISTTFASGVLVFGVAWLMSSIMKSSAMAAASSVMAAVLVVGTLMLPDFVHGSSDAYLLQRWFEPTCYVLGPLAFIAGVIICLRRTEL